jgi:hypothetical protein
MKRKIYEPVREFERATSYCPLYLAWRIVDEARDYFRTELIPSPVPRRRDILSHPMGEALAEKLARRAEAVFAHHPSWAREATPRGPAGARQQFQCQRQREFILQFMRHWLAGVLARENPVLYRQLPESFKVGHPLPEKPLTRKHLTPAISPERRGRTIRPRFLHGCELLPV